MNVHDKLGLCIATMVPDPEIPAPVTTLHLHSAATKDYQLHFMRNTPELNFGVIGSYQALYEQTTEPILAYIHDDVEVYQRGWDLRILGEFDDPAVGVVGFGGGLDHGTPDIYRRPYQLQQLARGHYLSNTRDAEAHGTRFAGSCDVAVLDGFALVVRRALLDKCGGWPAVPGGFHCYDYAICAEAHRYGYRVRMVGIDCHHFGGRTSTTPQYIEWAAKHEGLSDQEIHEVSHRWVYDNYRDVLPWRCAGDGQA